MTVNEAIKAADSARALNFGGQYQKATCVLADEVVRLGEKVIRLHELIKSCLPAIEHAMMSERMMNVQDKPFEKLWNDIGRELKSR